MSNDQSIFMDRKLESGNGSNLDDPCEVCQSQRAKYTCPGCLVRSCSLACVKQHKATCGCDGSAKRTRMVTLDQYDALTLLNDYRFLEETKRVIAKSRDQFKGLVGPRRIKKRIRHRPRVKRQRSTVKPSAGGQAQRMVSGQADDQATSSQTTMQPLRRLLPLKRNWSNQANGKMKKLNSTDASRTIERENRKRILDELTKKLQEGANEQSEMEPNLVQEKPNLVMDGKTKVKKKNDYSNFLGFDYSSSSDDDNG